MRSEEALNLRMLVQTSQYCSSVKISSERFIQIVGIPVWQLRWGDTKLPPLGAEACQKWHPCGNNRYPLSGYSHNLGLINCKLTRLIKDLLINLIILQTAISDRPFTTVVISDGALFGGNHHPRSILNTEINLGTFFNKFQENRINAVPWGDWVARVACCLSLEFC